MVSGPLLPPSLTCYAVEEPEPAPVVPEPIPVPDPAPPPQFDTIIVDTDPEVGGGRGFDCTLVETGDWACLYQEPSFPFDVPTDNFLFAVCATDITFTEPTSDNCLCAVALGTLDDIDNVEFCDVCVFNPTADRSDGQWTFQYNCQNLLQGPCIGRTANGDCISNVSSNTSPGSPSVFVDPDPEYFGGPGGFFCVEDQGDFVCAYPAVGSSYPFETPASFLFAVCDQDLTFAEPSSPSSCVCAVVLGSLLDIDNVDFCQSCTFVPTADPNDGVWQVAYSCENHLQGPCVGRDSAGNCISNEGGGGSDVVDPTPDTSGVWGFYCSPVDTNEYGCIYVNNIPFPFDYPDSFLFTVCSEDISLNVVEPDVFNCQCAVIIGSVDDVDNAKFCSTCSFLPTSSSTDGEWRIRFDCSNVLTGSCVGMTENGDCIQRL